MRKQKYEDFSDIVQLSRLLYVLVRGAGAARCKSDTNDY